MTGWCIYGVILTKLCTLVCLYHMSVMFRVTLVIQWDNRFEEILFKKKETIIMKFTILFQMSLHNIVLPQLRAPAQQDPRDPWARDSGIINPFFQDRSILHGEVRGKSETLHPPGLGSVPYPILVWFFKSSAAVVDSFVVPFRSVLDGQTQAELQFFANFFFLHIWLGQPKTPGPLHIVYPVHPLVCQWLKVRNNCVTVVKSVHLLQVPL